MTKSYGDTHPERVVVTGASSGLGLDIARRFLGTVLDVDGGYAHGR